MKIDEMSGQLTTLVNGVPVEGEESTLVTTGLAVEEQRFIWRIEKFDLVRRSRDLIQKQRFDYQAGHSLGLISNWSCRLWHYSKADTTALAVRSLNDAVQNEEWIGVFFHLEKMPESAGEFTFMLGFNIYKPDGSIFYSIEVPGRCHREVSDMSGWGKRCVIPKRQSVEHLPLTSDGALEIHVKFQLLSNRSAHSDLSTQIAHFRTLSVQKLSEDLLSVLQNNADFMRPSSPFPRTVKIISRDGVEFEVDQCFLIARSAVFQAMFLSKMQESQTGVINLDDLSSQTLEVFLHFIYTGVLHEKWCHPEVIVEFTYAADKYELTDLLHFLDHVLGTICNKEIAGRLLVLASKLSLKNAQKEVFSFIQKHATTAEQLISFARDMMNCSGSVQPFSNLIQL